QGHRGAGQTGEYRRHLKRITCRLGFQPDRTGWKRILPRSRFADADFGKGSAMSIERMVFVGLNGRVASLERDTDTTLWEGGCPKPRSGYVTLLVDGDRLFVTVNGYTYCLDAFTGEQLWYNPLKGYGTGVASI